MMNGLLQKEHGSKQAMWYIAWCSRETGWGGREDAVYRTKDAAQSRCDELNILYPDILHWPFKE